MKIKIRPYEASILEEDFGRLASPRCQQATWRTS